MNTATDSITRAADCLAPLKSSKSTDWNTPESFLDVVRQLGPIGLDPCSGAGSTVGARVEWRPDQGDDGLLDDWGGLGLVYANPPYGKTIKQWAAKIADEAARGVEIVALLPSRTDTTWFQNHVSTRADAICFWRGRLRFIDADGKPAKSGATFPCMAAYFGPRADRFRAIFAVHGFIVDGKRA
jgi:hypothetical protein